MSDALPELTKDELFARLADGHAAKISVITPNRRLAQALAREFDHRRIAAGLGVWETADILPYAAFVERSYEEALYSPLAAELPLLLTPDQEQSLWQDIVGRANGGEALLAVRETAALACDAWALAHAWCISDQLGGPLLDQDAATFVDWARDYDERMRRAHFTDHARLPEAVARALGEEWAQKPKLLVAYGFDSVTPQQRRLLEALAAHGVRLAQCGPARRAAQPARVPCIDTRDEIGRAACWARSRLEADSRARIAIVVPDLGRHKGALRRALAQAMAPGRAGGVLPFNISLGDPLTAHPLVAHALCVLELGGDEIEFERASLAVRSPFIAGGESETERRARLDAKLRRRAEPIVTLDRLVRLVADAPALADALGAYAEFKRRRLLGAQSPGDWARAFNDALARLGFPGERALDSAEYQTLKKWHEVLARFAALDRVAETMRFGEAFARLRRLAADTLFQPETPDVPIQVLGVLEAAGTAFDHLWVMGLSDEVWPMQARPNPFIALPLQRAARIPNASPAATLEFARRLTAQWLTGAGEVVLSHPQREADRDLLVSPLIGDITAGELALPEYATWRHAIQRSAKLEYIADAQAPVLAAGAAARGGASLIKDQAACPFRSFARHRLGARVLEAPHTGLDLRERGTLVHNVLAAVWRELKTKQALDATGESALEGLLAAAADEAIALERRRRPATLEGRFAAIEKARLVRLARDWLDHERRRGEFTVLAVEDQRAVEIGPLKLNLRLDRVDETGAGERVVIDYKSGNVALAEMCGPRPDEPQAALYLTAAEPDAAAAAFAQVRAGEMKFVGLARAEDLLPGVKTPQKADPRSGAAKSWDEQVASWRVTLDRIARAFTAGGAAVDPKRGPLTCRECDLQSFCRIAERTQARPEVDE